MTKVFWWRHSSTRIEGEAGENPMSATWITKIGENSLRFIVILIIVSLPSTTCINGSPYNIWSPSSLHSQQFTHAACDISIFLLFICSWWHECDFFFFLCKCRVLGFYLVTDIFKNKDLDWTFDLCVYETLQIQD